MRALRLIFEILVEAVLGNVESSTILRLFAKSSGLTCGLLLIR